MFRIDVYSDFSYISDVCLCGDLGCLYIFILLYPIYPINLSIRLLRVVVYIGLVDFLCLMYLSMVCLWYIYIVLIVFILNYVYILYIFLVMPPEY